MAVKQPFEYTGKWRQAILGVMGVLGGENYQYYNIDVTKAKEPSSSRTIIFFALKVLVSRADRYRAAELIRKALEEKDFIWYGQFPGTTDHIIVKRDGNQIDIAVQGDTDTVNTLRIDIKPEAGGGSGGGALETANNESAQCLYASVAFNVKRDLLSEDTSTINDDDFAEAAKFIEVDVDWKKLKPGEGGLSPEWRNSSVRGANELWNRYGKTLNPAKGTYWFFRGGGPDDNQIKKAYGRIRPGTPFSSEDKWNPADIWMIKKSELQRLEGALDDQASVQGVNDLIQKEFLANNMIGISLKKIVNTSATWSVKNLSTQRQARLKEVESYGFKSYDLYFVNETKKKEDDKWPMDNYIYFGPSAMHKFQARNFGGDSTASFQLELKGIAAAQGRIGGGVVVKIIKKLKDCKNYNLKDWPDFLDADNQTIWAKCDRKATDKMKITEEIEHLLKEHGQDIKGRKNNKKVGLEACPDNLNSIADRSRSYRYSKLMGLRLLSTLKAQDDGGDRIMREIYLYAASESDQSSVYAKME